MRGEEEKFGELTFGSSRSKILTSGKPEMPNSDYCNGKYQEDDGAERGHI